eukprot:118489_1
MAISFDYSLAITWAYFIVYVVMFLVVSIICAIHIKKESDPDASICHLIKAWGKSLWTKKKIYGELIPHFFDQATDFGVVVEFYLYYKSGDDIGINTKYLFVLSIAIIVLHRVISAIAVYNLTQKPMYAIYQLLDVLMIKCVYTNYQLDTTQPSNAQRYLQTMEAIFESAPQILISTAFLIKTSQTTISVTVIASLFTSLFSLSARVSADDKVMLQEDWKEPILRDEDDKWKFPFINIKYIIRVFFWRFLEISSRITLLVLCWINLGGKSIFFLLAIEFCYLTILAWGLGTIDIMGNVIYLMAANSKKKGYKWAVPMAYLFWAYRLLSSWVLLITVTVYAASNVQYGSELLNNEAGTTRREQTLGNIAGLMLFIYTWIAIPIWQWVGAVVIFDYKNLASVGRDIETLLDDDKWDQVLELVSFGARFDAAKIYQTIQRNTSVRTDNVDAPGSQKIYNCPGQHGLTEFQTGQDGYSCDICGDKFRKGETLYGCRNCNYDICTICNSSNNTIVYDLEGHALDKKATGYSGGYKCDKCKTSSDDTITWHCDECNYDLCDKCYYIKVKRKQKNKSKPENSPQERLADICKQKLEESEDDTQCAKTGKLCECLCSCPTFLILTGIIFISVGIYVFTSVGTDGYNFFFSVGAISVAALLIFCGMGCALKCCDKANNIMKNKKQLEMSVRRHKSAGVNVNCPGQHGLTQFITDHDGYRCDICKNKCNEGVQLWGCRTCNYDACMECKPSDPEPGAAEPEIDDGDTKGDDIVTCRQKHPLVVELLGDYQCNKCHQEFQNEKSWHCKQCNYNLCMSCFADTETFAQKGKRVVAWMNNRDVDDKPILFCGIVGWPLLIALAFFFGSDIAALIINSKYDCDIIGGSGYITFNTSVFLQCGAIIHLSILGMLLCCTICAAITDDNDISGLCIFGWICCAFLFFIPWIVIGFLLHSEMNDSNMAHQQCADMVYAWSIIKVIEFGGIPCLLLLLALGLSIFDGDMEDVMEKLLVGCLVCCGGICVLGFFLGSDVAMIWIHVENDCNDAIIGK